MTPEQKIKKKIFLVALAWNEDVTFTEVIDASNIDELYEEPPFCEDEITDAESEVRCSGVNTGLSSEHSRHYESDAVAIECDGEWVGFTYWYGGGKHGEPDAIEWMGEAYNLDVVEKEELVITRAYTVAK